MDPIPDIFIFFGRFHSLVVHLPIAFLALAVLLELLIRWPQFERFKSFIPFVWLLAACGAIVAVLLGYFLSLGGGYDEDTLYWHRLGGFALIFISVICLLLNVYKPPFLKKANRPVYYIFVITTVVCLIITGHLGGSLTHGDAYLVEFAPKFILGTVTPEQSTKKIITSLDSADIFNDAVLPILQTKCASCHNKEKTKGDLLLTSYDEIYKGGKSGPGLTPGNLATSEIFRRVSLPSSHKEFMPTGGKKPLSEVQLAILEWWIENGAQKKAVITDLHPNKKMVDVFSDFFQLGRDEILGFTAPPENPDVITSLLKNGYQVNLLSQGKNIYEVKRQGNSAEQPKLSDLLLLKDQLVWLQLIDCGITDEDLKTIGSLPNLYKLNLSRNKITDSGIKHLLDLPKLEYLNLNGTGITDSSVVALMALPKLKKLYVWDTAIDTLKLDNYIIPKKGLDLVYKLK